MTAEDRESICREMILNAIRRIERAQEKWKAAELDASSSSRDREDLKRHLAVAKDEFAWQWQNVRYVLEGQ